MSQKKIEMLAATLFLARELAHREHLKVTGAGSFARHAGATEPFYNEIVDLTDTLVETYQGIFDTILDIPLVTHDGELSIIDTLAGQLDWIHEARHEAIPSEWTCLHNIVDEIEGLYGRTLYRLRKLS